jgi:hypothetical protein
MSESGGRSLFENTVPESVWSVWSCGFQPQVATQIIVAWLRPLQDHGVTQSPNRMIQGHGMTSHSLQRC